MIQLNTMNLLKYVKLCNKELITCVVDEMTSVTLPYRFGKLKSN